MLTKEECFEYIEKKAFNHNLSDERRFPGMQHGSFSGMNPGDPETVKSDKFYRAWKNVDNMRATEGEKVKIRQEILNRAKAKRISTKGWSLR